MTCAREYAKCLSVLSRPKITFSTCCSSLDQPTEFIERDIKSYNYMIIDMSVEDRVNFDVVMVCIIDSYQHSRRLAGMKLSPVFYQI